MAWNLWFSTAQARHGSLAWLSLCAAALFAAALLPSCSAHRQSLGSAVELGASPQESLKVLQELRAWPMPSSSSSRHTSSSSGSFTPCAASRSCAGMWACVRETRRAPPCMQSLHMLGHQSTSSATPWQAAACMAPGRCPHGAAQVAAASTTRRRHSPYQRTRPAQPLDLFSAPPCTHLGVQRGAEVAAVGRRLLAEFGRHICQLRNRANLQLSSRRMSCSWCAWRHAAARQVCASGRRLAHHGGACPRVIQQGAPHWIHGRGGLHRRSGPQCGPAEASRAQHNRRPSNGLRQPRAGRPPAPRGGAAESRGSGAG